MKKMARLRQMPPHIEYLYWLYYSQGVGRSANKVAEQAKVPYKTVQNHITIYGWVDRVEFQDVEIVRQVKKQTVALAYMGKRDAFMTVSKLLAGARKDVEDGLLHISDIKDFVLVLKSFKDIVGDNTEVTEEEYEDAVEGMMDEDSDIIGVEDANFDKWGFKDDESPKALVAGQGPVRNGRDDGDGRGDGAEDTVGGSTDTGVRGDADSPDHSGDEDQPIEAPTQADIEESVSWDNDEGATGPPS